MWGLQHTVLPRGRLPSAAPAALPGLRRAPREAALTPQATEAKGALCAFYGKDHNPTIYGALTVRQALGEA